MKDKNELAKGWILKAESDLATARRMLASEGPFDTACFHCQQAIEKFLKAFLAFQGQQIPRTHDLEELAELCSLLDETLKWEELNLEEVTDYAVAVRYDLEFWPERDVAQETLKKAEKVKEEILLRLPPEAKP
ncbi:MAG: HEPN domain-containing protein [Armatimonadetes bacterium]|nr:HEPN domain-containing protein [Armatimonadota bacterium]